MYAAEAFEKRRDILLEQLRAAKTVQQAGLCASMMLEQVACDLAQEEQDIRVRQRQQAVMAVAKKMPLALTAARADGQIVLKNAQESGKKSARKGLTAAGLFVLGALAVYEIVAGHAVFALMQAAGAALLFAGMRREAPQPAQMEARGIARMDAEELTRSVMDICRAADMCTADLDAVEKAGRTASLTGTVDGATLDLLCAMLEAKASGREDAALRVMDQAEQTLRLMGMEAVFYQPDRAAYFDVLPTLSGAKTVRPALIKDGKLIRRGVAAVERGVRA